MQTGYQHPDMVVHRYLRQVVFTSRGSGWIPGACTAETGYRHKVLVLLSTERVTNGVTVAAVSKVVALVWCVWCVTRITIVVRVLDVLGDVRWERFERLTDPQHRQHIRIVRRDL